jgi:hypothetical protein
VRHGAERGEIAIDESGIDFAFAKRVGAAERAEEGDIAAHAGDSVRSSAVASRSSAASRVGACAMSLAIIGS